MILFIAFEERSPNLIPQVRVLSELGYKSLKRNAKENISLAKIWRLSKTATETSDEHRTTLCQIVQIVPSLLCTL